MKALAPMLALVLMAVAACDPGTRPPRTEVPDSLLVHALAESHIAGARASRSGENLDSLRSLAFEHLGVDSAQVARALDAYAERPAALADLYARVTDRLREAHEDLDEARRAWRRENLPDEELELLEYRQLDSDDREALEELRQRSPPVTE